MAHLVRQLGKDKRLRVRVYNSISTVLPGLLCISIAFFEPDRQPTVVIVLYTLASSFLGFAGGGFFSAIRYRSGAYSVFVVANVHAVCLVSHFFISLLNALIARNEEYNEWPSLFVAEGVMLILCNVIFCLTVNTDKAEWTREGYEINMLIAEDVAYRRRRGVSPKTWRIAEDVVYRRRRGVSPKT
ncbi:hypothetical protein PRIPAC_85105 [Pristionchus pacificus]|uniref:Uncharacterized protein n=1 Tax=Pristionchus pacificus TaxID=54126 RepID=A0A2A6BLN7_PRIPA|nr:hypothetical protein PRIPAC_85105 [Pristionchus pacificus]|eukprot:PDM66691.1 hypothetical protein PRIPAC_48108 [Pristionchus pacificus]